MLLIIPIVLDGGELRRAGDSWAVDVWSCADISLHSDY